MARWIALAALVLSALGCRDAATSSAPGALKVKDADSVRQPMPPR